MVSACHEKVMIKLFGNINRVTLLKTTLSAWLLTILSEAAILDAILTLVKNIK